MSGFLSAFILMTSFSAGVIPDYARVVGEDIKSAYSLNSHTRYFTDVKLELSYQDMLYVGYESETFMLKPSMSNLYFSPISAKYTATAGVRIGDFDVQFSHYCQHPVETVTNGIILTDRFFAAEDRITVKWSHKFSLGG
jgi:hypothetical protein